jgi:restriction system protein
MNIFISHSWNDRELAQRIADLLRSHHETVFNPGEADAPYSEFAAISASLRSAHAVVALVDSTDSNVFYELGLAFGSNVPVIVVAARRPELLPGSLTSLPYVQLIGDVSQDAQGIARRALSLLDDRQVLSDQNTLRADQFRGARSNLEFPASTSRDFEKMSPVDFERLVEEVFRNRGWRVEHTSLRNDTGIDFIADLGNPPIQVLVQVKKQSPQNRVSVESVRQVVDAVGASRASQGILVSSSGFTASAKALAAATNVELLTLDDVLTVRPKEGFLAPLMRYLDRIH